MKKFSSKDAMKSKETHPQSVMHVTDNIDSALKKDNVE